MTQPRLSEACSCGARWIMDSLRSWQASCLLAVSSPEGLQCLEARHWGDPLFLSWVCHKADCTTSLHTPSQGHMFHWFHLETYHYPRILNSQFLLAILFTGWNLFPVVSWSIIHYNVYLNLCAWVPACLCMLTNQIIKPIFSKDIRLFSIN